MIIQVLRFCQRIARYDGPGHDRALEVVTSAFPGVDREAVKRAFELGYKRGYADAGEYVADWIEEEEG